MEEGWERQQDVVVEEEEQEDDEGDILDMGEDDQETNEKEGLLMRFCPNDSSMLYPQEDKRNRILQYTCRLCSYREATPQYPLIYRNDLKHEVGNVLHTVPSSIADDPTLARSQNAKCSNCNHNEAVFFQSDIGQTDSLALIFVCCNCGHKWQVDAFIPSSLSRGTSGKCSSRTSLSESRRPSRYNNEGGREEEMYYERYSGGNKEERELKGMSLPRDIDEVYDENSGIARYGDDDEEDIEDYDDEYLDEYDDDSDDDYADEEADPGNFWSNPSGRMDRPIPARRRQGSVRQPRPRGYAADGRRSPAKRVPVRMKKRSGPNPAKDFYERLFWYGFDADENDGVGDKTVFGGTKGKFNGLSFKEASENSPYSGPNRPLRRRRGGDEYYEDENDFEIDDYGDEEYYEASERRNRSTKPPSDAPYPRAGPSGRGDRRRRRAKRQRPYEFDDRLESDNPGEWVSKSVSSWFTGDDADNNEDDDIDDRSRRTRRRRESSEWSPFNVVDKFFGVDRNEMKYQADLYDEKMGLGKKRSSSSRNASRERPRRQPPRRPGYAYKYNEDDDAELNPIVDVDMATPPEDDGSKTVDAQNSEAEMPSTSRPKRKEKSWEERSLAVERVPPAGIPAWGPSGEMPCDARTKAIMDALEDIQTARQKLERREKKEALAKEEITILKVDAELQRRKLRNSGRDDVQEQLRQIEFEMDDASRELRRARTSKDMAREQLAVLEERHWALLRFYDPEKAEQQVKAALHELGEVVPAARLPDSSVSVESVEANGSGDSS